MYGCCQTKGWMDVRGMKIWTGLVWKPFVASHSQSVLSLDDSSCHKQSYLLKAAQLLETNVELILGGYSCALQPSNVGVTELKSIMQSGPQAKLRILMQLHRCRLKQSANFFVLHIPCSALSSKTLFGQRLIRLVLQTVKYNIRPLCTRIFLFHFQVSLTAKAWKVFVQSTSTKFCRNAL